MLKFDAEKSPNPPNGPRRACPQEGSPPYLAGEPPRVTGRTPGVEPGPSFLGYRELHGKNA